MCKRHTHVNTLMEANGIEWGNAFDVISEADYLSTVMGVARWLVVNDAPEELLNTLPSIVVFAQFSVNRKTKQIVRRRVCTLKDLHTGPLSVFQYNAILHELGHMLHPEGHIGPGDNDLSQPIGCDVEMTREIAAWEWAVDNTQEWNSSVHMMMRAGLELRLEYRDTPLSGKLYTRMQELYKASMVRFGLGGLNR